jgi:hypothetical protein
MPGSDVVIGIGPRNVSDYRKVNVDQRSLHSGDEGGDIVTSRLPCGADYFSVAYPSATQEVYTFRLGGASGTIVATYTHNYTNATKVDTVDGTWS